MKHLIKLLMVVFSVVITCIPTAEENRHKWKWLKRCTNQLHHNTCGSLTMSNYKVML